MPLFDCHEQNYPRVLIFLTPLTSNFGGLKDLGNKHFDNLCSTKIHNQTNFYDYVLDSSSTCPQASNLGRYHWNTEKKKINK